MISAASIVAAVLVVLVLVYTLFGRFDIRPSYNAKMLADSIASGVRLATIEVVFPRFILAEFNTHRMFSRNSASSRAIPVDRRIAQVWRNPFVPEAFGVNKSGMQASANLGGWKATLARRVWLAASRVCCMLAWCMSKLGVHKQHANRLLEPWAWHTVVVSATEWDNFFALRCHPAAQPEMQITAKRMREVFDASKPRELKPGEWHLPYVTDSDRARFQLGARDPRGEHYAAWMTLVKISVARCAAVSFERQEAERTIEQLTARHDSLAMMAHWSPFEHQAQAGKLEEPPSEDDRPRLAPRPPMTWFQADGGSSSSFFGHPGQFIGNFRAPWVQYRKTFRNESVFAG